MQNEVFNEYEQRLAVFAGVFELFASNGIARDACGRSLLEQLLGMMAIDLSYLGSLDEEANI